MKKDICGIAAIVNIFILLSSSIAFCGDTGRRVPVLDLPEKVVDLGKAVQGERASGGFVIRNHGSAPLKILDIKPSCGCTVAELPAKEIKPGGEVRVDVKVDTSGKVGKIRKSVRISTNDPVTPVTTVEILVDVILPEHVDMKNGRLFKGACAGCHADPAKGLTGEGLFEAVCAFCHGHYGLGGVAKRINSLEYLESHSDGYIKDVIMQGKSRTSMPGFWKEAGGPLSEEQIDSLVKLIRWWEEGFVFKRNEERSRRR